MSESRARIIIIVVVVIVIGTYVYNAHWSSSVLVCVCIIESIGGVLGKHNINICMYIISFGPVWDKKRAYTLYLPCWLFFFSTVSLFVFLIAERFRLHHRGRVQGARSRTFVNHRLQLSINGVNDVFDGKKKTFGIGTCVHGFWSMTIDALWVPTLREEK